MTTHDPDCRHCSAKVLREAQEAERRHAAELRERVIQIDEYAMFKALSYLIDIAPDLVDEALTEVES